MKFLVLASFALLAGATTVDAAGIPRFRDVSAPWEQRVDDLLRRLTLEEKVALCSGRTSPAAEERFFSGGVPRLGIAPLSFRDGPVGVRTFDRSPATALPSTLGLACTWDVAAARDYGRVLAEEMLASHRQVLLGPGLNLMRDPRGGRNYEYLGEDPFLCGTIGAAYILAVQERGIGADAKHYVANDYETRRHFTSANLDERTLREMHLLPFEMAVRDGHVWTVMTANSLVNGTHVTANREIVQGLLKDRLGFDGVVLTDWRAAYDTVPSALAGTDMTTGLCAYVFGDGHLLAAAKSGAVPAALIEEKARRILRLYARTGLLDPAPAASRGAIDSPEHRATARRLAAESIVLLKNDRGLLPLDPAKLRSVFITGPGANHVASGRGSGLVHSAFQTTVLEGLRRALGDKVSLRQADWPAPKEGRAAKSARPERHALAPEDLAGAEAADVVVFCAIDAPHGEGGDLEGLDLPGGQSEAIAALAARNRHVIVLLQSGQPVLLEPFVDAVPAIVAGWYPGQSAGDAFADVLTGKVNPSGRLSSTFARRLADYPCEALGLWPPRAILNRTQWDAGMTPKDRRATYGVAADYKEGVFIGYRWFDRRKLEPRFAFGHGLSYTTFAFSHLAVDARQASWRVTCTVRNTGARAGDEVVQVYIAPPPSRVKRPVRELRGFTRVTLAPGESREVTIVLRPSAPCYFDERAHNWHADAGTYQVEIGASSRDIRLRKPVQIERDLAVDWY